MKSRRNEPLYFNFKGDLWHRLCSDENTTFYGMEVDPVPADADDSYILAIKEVEHPTHATYELIKTFKNKGESYVSAFAPERTSEYSSDEREYYSISNIVADYSNDSLVLRLCAYVYDSWEN